MHLFLKKMPEVNSSITVFDTENGLLITEDIHPGIYHYGLTKSRVRRCSSMLDYKAAPRDMTALEPSLASLTLSIWTSKQ